MKDNDLKKTAEDFLVSLTASMKGMEGGLKVKDYEYFIHEFSGINTFYGFLNKIEKNIIYLFKNHYELLKENILYINKKLEPPYASSSGYSFLINSNSKPIIIQNPLDKIIKEKEYKGSILIDISESREYSVIHNSLGHELFLRKKQFR